MKTSLSSHGGRTIGEESLSSMTSRVFLVNQELTRIPLSGTTPTPKQKRKLQKHPPPPPLNPQQKILQCYDLKL